LVAEQRQYYQSTNYANNLAAVGEHHEISSNEEHKRIRQAEKINQHRRDLHLLNIGDKVYMQPLAPHQHEWQPATVSKRLKSRTYEVTTQTGSILTRNRRFISHFKPHEGHGDSFTANNTVTGSASVQENPVRPTESSHAQPELSRTVTNDLKSDSYCTRSGRLSRPPQKLNL